MFLPFASPPTTGEFYANKKQADDSPKTSHPGAADGGFALPAGVERTVSASGDPSPSTFFRHDHKCHLSTAGEQFLSGLRGRGNSIEDALDN
jgi:hypothetical protein